MAAILEGLKDRLAREICRQHGIREVTCSSSNKSDINSVGQVEIKNVSF
ncbi:hypothetical protein KAR10_05690 [bacterium]|nr:hypothetical protein [bacterium]